MLNKRKRDLIKELKSHNHKYNGPLLAILPIIAAVGSAAGGIASAIAGKDEPEVPRVKQTPEQTALTSRLSQELGEELPLPKPGDLNYRPFGSIGSGLTSAPGSITERVASIQQKLGGQVGAQPPDFGSIQPQMEDPFKKKQRFGLTGF